MSHNNPYKVYAVSERIFLYFTIYFYREFIVKNDLEEDLLKNVSILFSCKQHLRHRRLESGVPFDLIGMNENIEPIFQPLDKKIEVKNITEILNEGRAFLSPLEDLKKIINISVENNYDLEKIEQFLPVAWSIIRTNERNIYFKNKDLPGILPFEELKYLYKNPAILEV